MRQERIAKKPRRRTTRQVQPAPLELPTKGADLGDADAILHEIDVLMEQLREAA
jgi:hypothetical protein